jgi:D-beta-D-heptose 7-phosphate kinase/D-beta-D-heptose 1-phosphate adenosyltransferase
MIEMIKKFPGKEITVIGDVILDHFANGINGRISSEAPVHIVTVHKDDFMPGGAGNVVRNISSLGGRAKLISLTGDDDCAKILRDLLEKEQVEVELILDKTRPTPRKMRVVSEKGQEICVHWEDLSPASEDIVRQALMPLWRTNSSVIVISDYGRGLITPELLKSVIEYSHQTGKKVIIDPRPRDGWDCENYKGAFLLTPNRKEAEDMSGKSVNSLEDAYNVAQYLSKKLEANVLITLDCDGMVISQRSGEIDHIPAIECNMIECVSGCGDSVITTIALAISSGASIKEACELSSHTAAVVIRKPGTAIANFSELISQITSYCKVNIPAYV